MAYHFIAIASSYTKGSRIGWHYASEGKLDKDYIQEFKRCVYQKCGDIPLGMHKITTESTSWASVVQNDKFFADVFCTDDIALFAKYAAMDKELTAENVAKFMLQVQSVTQLKLQKLLYLAYSDFLLKTGERLFKDKIVAYKYGPVVENVLWQFTDYGANEINYEEDAHFSLIVDEPNMTPSLISVLSSEHGLDAAEIILETVEKYAQVDAFNLVKFTHVTDGPWARAYGLGRNQEITDQLIKRYHYLVEDEADKFLAT